MNNKVVVVVVVKTRRDAHRRSRRDALRPPSQLNHTASRRSCNRLFLKDMRDRNWVRSLFFNCFIITGRVEREAGSLFWTLNPYYLQNGRVTSKFIIVILRWISWSRGILLIEIMLGSCKINRISNYDRTYQHVKYYKLSLQILMLEKHTLDWKYNALIIQRVWKFIW